MLNTWLIVLFILTVLGFVWWAVDAWFDRQAIEQERVEKEKEVQEARRQTYLDAARLREQERNIQKAGNSVLTKPGDSAVRRAKSQNYSMPYSPPVTNTQYDRHNQDNQLLTTAVILSSMDDSPSSYSAPAPEPTKSCSSSGWSGDSGSSWGGDSSSSSCDSGGSSSFD